MGTAFANVIVHCGGEVAKTAPFDGELPVAELCARATPPPTNPTPTIAKKIIKIKRLTALGRRNG
jgi:hypothetical protein